MHVQRRHERRILGEDLHLYHLHKAPKNKPRVRVLTIAICLPTPNPTLELSNLQAAMIRQCSSSDDYHGQYGA
jgi:hypothetical protein